MHETHRLAALVLGEMRGVETAQDSDHHGHRDGRRDAPPGEPRGVHQPGERDAVHQLHHDTDPTLVFEHVDHAHHVGVADARHVARFGDQRLGSAGVVRQLRRQAFDRDDLVEAGTPEQPREMHSGHSARGDLVQDHVSTCHRDRSRYGL